MQKRSTKEVKPTVNNRSKSTAPKPKSLAVGSEVVTKATRIEAMGKMETCKDPCLKNMISKAEILFRPMKIHTNGDWLVAHKESGQTFDSYLKPGAKNAVTEKRNKIYIFI